MRRILSDRRKMEMKKYDVTALGELLIDFTENGISAQGNPLFEANPGGAPCNVLAMLAKLRYRTAFIGKVGRDCFGDQLRTAIMEAGICSEYLMTDEEVHTTLAVVHTFPDGDRDFSFYRDPGADMMLREDEISEDLIRDSKIFHFGTLSMTHEGVRAATKKAVRIAEEAGCILSFDPNLRPPLWNSLEEAKECLKKEKVRIRHIYMLWFQGEADANLKTTKDEYKAMLRQLVSYMEEQGVENHGSPAGDLRRI